MPDAAPGVARHWYGLVPFASSIEKQYVKARRQALLVRARSLLTRGAVARHASEWVGGLGESDASMRLGAAAGRGKKTSPFGSAERERVPIAGEFVLFTVTF